MFISRAAKKNIPWTREKFTSVEFLWTRFRFVLPLDSHVEPSESANAVNLNWSIEASSSLYISFVVDIASLSWRREVTFFCSPKRTKAQPQPLKKRTKSVVCFGQQVVSCSMRLKSDSQESTQVFVNTTTSHRTIYKLSSSWQIQLGAVHQKTDFQKRKKFQTPLAKKNRFFGPHPPPWPKNQIFREKTDFSDPTMYW